MIENHPEIFEALGAASIFGLLAAVFGAIAFVGVLLTRLH